MKSLFNEPLPFSDYVIVYFVEKFGVEWVDFYHIILVIITGFSIGGWVLAFYLKTKCQNDIHEALKDKD